MDVTVQTSACPSLLMVLFSCTWAWPHSWICVCVYSTSASVYLHIHNHHSFISRELLPCSRCVTSGRFWRGIILADMNIERLVCSRERKKGPSRTYTYREICVREREGEACRLGGRDCSWEDCTLAVFWVLFCILFIFIFCYSYVLGYTVSLSSLCFYIFSFVLFLLFSF